METEHFSKYIKKRGLSDKNILIPSTAGDCIELLRKLFNNSIDMTFVDPLFSLRKNTMDINDHLKDREYLSWRKMWILELAKVTEFTGERCS
jgi:site-specific DNA-methyltransferase (adenine-specific)